MDVAHRKKPPRLADELVTLTSFLEYQRETLAIKCAGLSAAQLRERAVPPSALSLLGLVRHLAEVEQSWFQLVMSGQPVPYLWPQGPGEGTDDSDGSAEFDVTDADPEEAFEVWRAECARSRDVVDAAESLDVTGHYDDETFSLRYVLTHMIQEYAQHNGHADLLRERIDGVTGLGIIAYVAVPVFQEELAMRLGLVGYGVGGRYFHAPFVQAAEELELAGVVTRDPRRRAELGQDYPGVPVYDSQRALLDAGVDIVTITTPPQTRRELVLEAVAAGAHVVADKPFAPTAAAARELAGAAQTAGVVLTVFHNRRWDADIRTLRATIGRLGNLQKIESRFDLDQPGLLETGPHGGLLRDLGSHLVDQMLWLLGPAATVHAALDWTEFPDGRTDSAFDITLTHLSGVRSRVSATKLNRLDDRELRAYGTAGAYIGHSTDVQARTSLAGRRPADLGDAWGYEPEESWGVLYTAAGAATVPSERGAYQDFYSEFAAALRGEGPVPVPVREAIDTLEVLDAARTSAAEGRVVALRG